MQQLSEKTIISRLSDPATRHQTFSYVVDQYSQQLYWKIRGIVVFHDDADDVLQNTFLKAWKSLDDFQGKSKLYTWLYRIAVNEALDFLRRKKNQQALSADMEPHLANRMMADEYFDGDRSEALLQEAVATLPAVQRTVFTMKYFEEMKYSAMSEILNTSEGALKASYHIAVQKVTEYVKSHS